MKQDLKSYLLDRNGYLSLMNMNIRDMVIYPDDYEEFIITDYYKFRIDRISELFLQSNQYYFIIMWFNGITDMNELASGNLLLIPTKTFIDRLYKMLKEERGEID